MKTSGFLGHRQLASARQNLEAEVASIGKLNIDQLRDRWRQVHKHEPPAALTKDLLARALSYWRQEQMLPGLTATLRRELKSLAKDDGKPARRHLKVGSVLVREHQGVLHEVTVTPDGFHWRGQTFSSLSTIAKAITGTSWNGPRFFGLRTNMAASS